MKTYRSGILLMVALLVFCSLAFCSIPFLNGVRSDTELSITDKPVLKVDKVEEPTLEQEIQIRNDRLIRYFATRHGEGLLTKDMVDMNKPIKHISGGTRKNLEVFRITYEDGSEKQYTIHR